MRMRIVHYIDKFDVTSDQLFVVSRAYTTLDKTKIIIDIKDVVTTGGYPIDYAEISSIIIELDRRKKGFKDLKNLAFWLRKEVLETNRLPKGSQVRVKAYDYSNYRAIKVDTGYREK